MLPYSFSSLPNVADTHRQSVFCRGPMCCSFDGVTVLDVAFSCRRSQQGGLNNVTVFIIFQAARKRRHMFHSGGSEASPIVSFFMQQSYLSCSERRDLLWSCCKHASSPSISNRRSTIEDYTCNVDDFSRDSVHSHDCRIACWGLGEKSLLGSFVFSLVSLWLHCSFDRSVHHFYCQAASCCTPQFCLVFNNIVCQSRVFHSRGGGHAVQQCLPIFATSSICFVVVELAIGRVYLRAPCVISNRLCRC